MAEQTETKEVSKNCPACKKVMKRARRYYRNGAYYCNKNCYHKVNVKEAAPAEVTEEAK